MKHMLDWLGDHITGQVKGDGVGGRNASIPSEAPPFLLIFAAWGWSFFPALLFAMICNNSSCVSAWCETERPTRFR